jgi:DNA-directed RNA polymerase specialized sigma24 family protein
VNDLEARRVRGAIHKLPLEFREIIVLREYEELSYREIAGCSGLSRANSNVAFGKSAYTASYPAF